ncbi:hypothetical protein LMG31506_05895 [Cupriavidus yeoncheonensis]|uniref:Uncharacterized protein n=1 Tax=Cupriavidus yeoncheonensis TaxID=1462994 RepID=A0A916MY89_9BURK|nr:hypothetical protein LMG31506_05895 [Cupriavidus yeoncheonensis]
MPCGPHAATFVRAARHHSPREMISFMISDVPPASLVDSDATMQMMRNEYVRFGKLVEQAKIRVN